MQYKASSPKEYIDQLPEDRQIAIKKLCAIIKKNLPKGFEEGMQYGMIGYYISHNIYPNGYHCNPKDSLPFMSVASQKKSINLYSSGLYAKKEIYDWFVTEFPNHSKQKLDMGKSCVRFKNPSDIPYELIAELSQKITVDEWINIYENTLKKKS